MRTFMLPPLEELNRPPPEAVVFGRRRAREEVFRVHEASAAEAILRIVSAESEARGRARVSKIRLVVGEATGYMEESLELFFRQMAAGGPAADAVLELRYVKTRLRCPSCGAQFDRRGSSFACPVCGGPAELAGGGDEFYVDSLEIEER
jgi:hydrogenase nickel incorporation protein HypA/HybF